MKVLFVVNNNYPHNGTGTNLLSKLLFEGGLYDKFQTVDVLAGKDEFYGADYETVGDSKIYHVGAWSLYPTKDVKIAMKRHPIQAVYGIIVKVLYHLERKYNKDFFYQRDAYRAFYAKLKEINATQYDMIVTLSGNYYQTVAVMKYCKKTKQKFFLYQVDPCSTNRSISERSLSARRKFDKELYEMAAAVATTPIIKGEMNSLISPEIMEKVVEMEFPLISKQAENAGEREHSSSKPVCMFVGNIYGGIRNPDYTLRLFRELIEKNEIEFHFVGVKQEDVSAEFKDLGITYHGRVPLEQALMMMNQADFLVNIGNSMDNQVPSKIFDYISTGSPIVNVCKSRKCPTLPYMAFYPHVINLFEEDDKLGEQVGMLGEFIRDNYGKRTDYKEVERLYEKCTPKYCAEIMYELIAKSI